MDSIEAKFHIGLLLLLLLIHDTLDERFTNLQWLASLQSP